MENSIAPLSRQAKIKFIGNSEILIGTVIYSGTQTEIGANEVCISNFRFKPQDETQPEQLYDFWKIDMLIFF